MAISGNGNLSIRKKDVKESKSISTGFRNLKFAHKANAGETGIDINSLALPSELAGFSNPSSATLLAANLRRNRDNLRVVSSLSGELLDYTSYTVTASRINFNGFTAEQDEIFVCYLDSAPTNGVQVVSGAPLVSTGELPDGSTDYNVGELFQVNANPTKQVGAVVVERNGIQQFRCVDNDITQEGNYIEVSNGTGLGQIIRFKNAPSGQDDSILVTSVGALVEKPNDSQLAQISNVAGQVDRIVDFLSEELEVPSTDFQAAPTEPDLKQFGDRVLDLETGKQDTFTQRYQFIPLPSDVTANGNIVGWGINNLEIGKTYRIYGQIALSNTSAGIDNVQVVFDYVTSGDIVAIANPSLGTSGFLITSFDSPPFVATESSIKANVASLSAGNSIVGSGAINRTYVVIEELPNHQVTTQFT